MHTNKLTVRSRPLDELLADEQRPIRLIKIDVEGAELMVLKGMEQLLQRQSPIPAVIIEFSPKQVEAVDPGMKWFLEYVGRHGFEIHPFISHEAPTVVPAKIKTETLARIYGDFLDQGAVAELDLLLVHPDALGHN